MKKLFFLLITIAPFFQIHTDPSEATPLLDSADSDDIEIVAVDPENNTVTLSNEIELEGQSAFIFYENNTTPMIFTTTFPSMRCFDTTENREFYTYWIDGKAVPSSTKFEPTTRVYLTNGKLVNHSDEE